MNIKYVIIVLGEPFSIFSELIGKYFKKRKIKKKNYYNRELQIIRQSVKKIKL